jgi:hypothetical protein
MLLIGAGLLWLLAAILPPRGRRAPASVVPRRPGSTDGRHLHRLLGHGGGAPADQKGSVRHRGRARRGAHRAQRRRLGRNRPHGPDAPAHRARPRGRGWLACYGFAPLALLVPVHPAVVFAAYAIAGLGIDLFNVPGSPPRSARSSRVCRPGCPRWTSWSPTVWPRSAWPFWPRRRDLRLATGAGRLRARVFRGSRRSRPDPHHSPLLPPPGHGRAETEPSKRWTGRAGPRNKIMMSAIWMVAR